VLGGLRFGEQLVNRLGSEELTSQRVLLTLRSTARAVNWVIE
jgi:hypothetical protein